MFFTFVLGAEFRMKPKTISFFYNAMNYLIELVPVLVLTAGNDERRLYRRISPVFAAQILTQSDDKTVSQRPKKKSDCE